MGFSLGKLIHDASSKVSNTVKQVESKAQNVVKAAEQKVSHVVDVVKDTADTFEKGVVEPLLHRPDLGDPYAQPALYKEDGKTTTWQTLPGQLTVDGIQAGDVNQGRIGDCYFLSTMASVAATHPELIQNAITQNPDGTYSVQFHQTPAVGDVLDATGWGGVGAEGYVQRFLQHFGVKPTEVQTVQIDGKLPVDGGGDPYVHNGNNELWPMLMEKAFAKQHGGYTAIGSGAEAGSALMAVTGAPLDHISNKHSSTDELWAKLSDASAKKNPMVASTGLHAPDPNIVTRHCYSVLGTEEKDGQRLVVVRNPWGHHEPGSDGADDGVFRMTVEEFQKNFAMVDIAKVS